MKTKKALVKKIIKAKKKMLKDCVDRVQALLKQSKNLKADNILERWSVHHNLLSELQLLETMITNSDKNQRMIHDIKSIANDIVPIPNGVY
ncbi:MAG: hypothetical protein IIC67_06615, partial [Thaumarchaeota archaeon]|nr:hypothetical protein [Nitrososphaerota archaeon]